jgi:hypothetical protein
MGKCKESNSDAYGLHLWVESSTKSSVTLKGKWLAPPGKVDEAKVTQFNVQGFTYKGMTDDIEMSGIGPFKSNAEFSITLKKIPGSEDDGTISMTLGGYEKQRNLRARDESKEDIQIDFSVLNQSDLRTPREGTRYTGTAAIDYLIDSGPWHGNGLKGLSLIFKGSIKNIEKMSVVFNAKDRKAPQIVYDDVKSEINNRNEYQLTDLPQMIHDGHAPYDGRYHDGTFSLIVHFRDGSSKQVYLFHADFSVPPPYMVHF